MSEVYKGIKSILTAYWTKVKNYIDTKLSGKSDTGHKHSASDIASGVLPVANGGTGVTTQADINKAFISNLDVGNSDVTDGTEFVSSWASNNGFAETAEGALNKPYKRQFIKVWNYIKGKISSVLGLTATNYSGNSATATTADKTVNDITIDIPYVGENGQYVIPLGNIPEPTSTEGSSPYNWDITGFFSIIRESGHAGSHINFAAGHGYSHSFTTYAYLDEESFTVAGTVGMSIKAFQYNGEWWLGLWVNTQWQGYTSKMTITFSRGLPATPTCILYNSRSDGVANEEIYNSIQDIPSGWWRTRTIYNPTTFTQNITASTIKAETNFIGNLTGNVSGSSGSCTGNSATATSVIDAGDTSSTVAIGFHGAGLTVDEVGYIAGYKVGTSGSIKDVSKDVLQSWAGIGSLSSLTTTDKSNLVSAINEVKSGLGNYLLLSGGTMTGKLDVNTAGIRIPTSQPSSLKAGDIWIQ